MAGKAHRKGRRKFGYIRKLSTGFFQASYKRNVGGQVRTFYNPERFTTQREAETWLASEYLLILQGSWTTPGTPDPKNTETPTFEQSARRYVELQTNLRGMHLKPSTQEKYMSYLNGALAGFKHLKISDISIEMVDQWWSRQIKTGKVSSASKAYKFLHAVIRREIRAGFFTSANPCQVRGAHNAVTGRETYTPSLAEVSMVAKELNQQFMVMTLLSTFAALRYGEVSALTLGDIHPIVINGAERYEISINKAVSFVGGKYLLGSPKSENGKGSIVISSAITQTLHQYLEQFSGEPRENLLFPHRDGGYIPNYIFAKALKKATQKAGFPTSGITPHSLRRAGATEYANLGANFGEVQDFLRDKSAQAALVYVKPTQRSSELAEAMRLP